MSTRRIPVVLVLFVFTAAGLVEPVTANPSDGQFGLESLEGAWGFNAWGVFNTREARSAVGRHTFDGEGGCTSTAVLVSDFYVWRVSTTEPGGSCTYTVSPDGTGTLEVQFVNTEDPSGGTVAGIGVYFVIVDEGNELLYSVSSEPVDPLAETVMTGVAKRQPTPVPPEE